MREHAALFFAGRDYRFGVSAIGGKMGCETQGVYFWWEPPHLCFSDFFSSLFSRAVISVESWALEHFQRYCRPYPQ
jgi:hypothetical protein